MSFILKLLVICTKSIWSKGDAIYHETISISVSWVFLGIALCLDLISNDFITKLSVSGIYHYLAETWLYLYYQWF